jgi:hypothetical protein
MSRPKKKSTSTLVKLGPALDRAMMALGNRNAMSYSATVRLLVMLGCRSLTAYNQNGSYKGRFAPDGMGGGRFQ